MFKKIKRRKIIMAEEVKETMEQFETQLEESLNKAATNEDAVWNHLEELKESGEVLALTVGGVVNGGVIVYVEGIRGFIPASLLSTKYVEDLNVWLQKDVEAKIITVEPEDQRLVLSAKAVEQDKARKERENKINELKVGTVVEGLFPQGLWRLYGLSDKSGLLAGQCGGKRRSGGCRTGLPDHFLPFAERSAGNGAGTNRRHLVLYLRQHLGAERGSENSGLHHNHCPVSDYRYGSSGLVLVQRRYLYGRLECYRRK